MQRKGELDLEMIGKTILVALTLVLLAVVSLLIYQIMSAESVIPPKTIAGNHFENNTIVLNSSSQAVGGSGTPATCTSLRSPTLTNIVVRNNTNGVIFGSGNYSVVGCAFTNLTNLAGYTVNVSADYSYLTSSDAVNVVGNTSNGTVSFFTNIPTIFVALGVTVIILAIGLILYVVRRLQSRDSVSEI